MDVGVLIQGLAPSMKYGRKTYARLKPSFCDLLERFRHRPEQDIEADLLIGKDHRIKFMRHSEDDVEVLRWQQLSLPCIHPLGLRQVLALRAMTVAARVIGKFLVLACIALQAMPTKDGSPAIHNVGDDFGLGFR